MSRAEPKRTASVVIDLVAMLAALSAAGVWAERTEQSGWRICAEVTGHLVLFGLVWLLITNRLGTYQIPLQRNRRLAMRSMVEAWAVTWGVGGLLSVTILAHPVLDIWVVLVAGLAMLGFTRLVLSRSPLGHGVGRLRTLVVGACSTARSLSSSREAQSEMDLIGFVPFSGEEVADMPHLAQLGTLANLEQTFADHQVDLAMVCPSDKAITGEVHKVFHACDELGLSIQYFPSFLDLRHLHVGLSWHASMPHLSLQTLPNQSFAQLAKRVIDVAGALVGLLALLPVFITCALAVKLTSRGPVFYRQTRVGKNGEHFTCFKFRTMRVGAHAQQELLRSASVQDGPAFKIPKDPRITPVGRVLRKFSLDELPQLLNVLLGDMSLVGPRPPIPTEVEKYTWWQRRRISVKPGLTCVWQVWGRNRVSFKRWVEMDLYYIDNWSLWLDLKLIAHTFRAVLAGTGM